MMFAVLALGSHHTTRNILHLTLTITGCYLVTFPFMYVYIALNCSTLALWKHPLKSASKSIHVTCCLEGSISRPQQYATVCLISLVSTPSIHPPQCASTPSASPLAQQLFPMALALHNFSPFQRDTKMATSETVGKMMLQQTWCHHPIAPL